MGGNDPKLRSGQKSKLNDLFHYIVSKASVDYNNQEIRDIQAAVYAMLSRVSARINDRGVFHIWRIQPCGSMAEESSVWKIDEETLETYTEFDFLAVLNNFVEYSRNRPCLGCEQVKIPPLETKPLEKLHNMTIKHFMKKENLVLPPVLKNLFWQELTWCLTCSCNCLFVNYYDIHGDNHLNDVFGGIYTKVAFQPTSKRYEGGCDKCVIEMRTGTLRVNTSIRIDQSQNTPSKCSLIFVWTSKATTLFVPDKLLKEKRQMGSLPIYIDCLPALQIQKENPNHCLPQQEKLLVPKQCVVCGKPRRWTISSCMEEMYLIIYEMSRKHRKCFRLMKYLLPLADVNNENLFSKINTYHMKTIVLQHMQACLDSSEDCVDCVLEIFKALQNAYRMKHLKSPFVEVNLLDRDDYTAHTLAEIYLDYIDKLYSVCENDCWKTFVQKIVF